MDKFDELLRALTDDDNTTESSQQQGGGLFDAIDPDMLIRIMELLESMNKQSDDEKLLLALKPLLREENRAKVDTAVKLLKIMALLPIIKDSGMLGKLL
ncbi:MAG: hypothetical protein ACI4KM_10150 [Oscillospiraceae bacterium]